MSAVDPKPGVDQKWKTRLQRLRSVAAGRELPAKYRPWLFAVAVCTFVGVSVLSFGSLPSRAQFDWWPLPLLLLVMSPLTILVNAAEYRVMGAINGHSIRWRSAVQLVVFASAANLLPLPGGTVIRSEALHRLGSRYRHAIAANAAAWFIWFAVACISIGSLFASNGRDAVASAALIVVGVLIAGGVWLLLRRVSGSLASRRWVQLVVVEGATVAITGTRIFLAFRLIGLSASAAQAVALSGAQIIASAVGIFPAGLGLRETLAGLIGSAVNIGVYETVAATASDRVTSLLGLAIACGLLMIFTRRDGRSLPEPEPGPCDSAREVDEVEAE